MVEEAGDRVLADVVGTASELAQDTLLAVVTQPLGSGGQTLGADGAADTLGVGARAVSVEVLVHLVDELVLGVAQVLQVVVGLNPVPGAGPGVTLGENVLAGSASGTDGVNGSLVEVEDEGLVHVVVLVVGVEDDALVALEGVGQVGEEGLEGGEVGDDGALVAAVVVGVDDGVFAARGDVVDRLGQVGQVARVEAVGEGVDGHTLHEEGNTEGVEALVDESLDKGSINMLDLEGGEHIIYTT